MIVDGIELDPNNLPKHIAIIMDGNKRWAQENSVSVMRGHREGLERVIESLGVCEELGISVLTLFAFSTENWKRSSKEISGLLKLFKYFFDREFKNLKKRNVKVLHSGLKKAFDKGVQKIIDTMVDETKENNRAILNLAINYSGRLEIVEAVKSLIQQVKDHEMDVNELCEEHFSQCLFHPELPEPDLLIRTSGEQRISNFLLWQTAYTELYFTNILWPNFSRKDLLMAISDYQGRERRYGGRSE